LQGLGNGATFKEISKAIVERIEIPLPPLDEQRRIAAILDKADALRRKRTRALDLLDGLSQSIFLQMFGDLVSSPKKWGAIQALGNFSDIASGITKGRKLNGEAVREVPYLAVSNVQDKFLDMTVVKTIEASENEIERYRLMKNDLLLTEGGDPDKLGRGTLWADELNESIHQNHIFRVRVTSNEVLPFYLIWLLGSPYGKAYFLKSAKQTTGIASINKRQLSGFPVILPPIGLQAEFEKKVQLVNRAIETTKAANKSIGCLFSSLQHRAFSGQL
jgi:type I restriction enzyme S subunit